MPLNFDSRMTRFLIFFFVAISFCSCSEPVFPEDYLIVEGWICNGENPVVSLTRPYRPGTDMSVEDLVARPAKVVLCGDDDEWVLYGRRDNNFVPAYVYTSPLMWGETGKTYTMVAESDDLKIMAESSIPSPASILRVWSGSEDVEADSLRSVSLTMKPVGVDEEYYMIMLTTENEFLRPMPALMGVFSTCGGDPVDVRVLRPKANADDKNSGYVKDFRVGEKLGIRLCRMNRDGYEFWLAYQNAISVGSSSIISTSYSMPTNVQGGAGIFAGYGVSQTEFVVK